MHDPKLYHNKCLRLQTREKPKSKEIHRTVTERHRWGSCRRLGFCAVISARLVQSPISCNRRTLRTTILARTQQAIQSRSSFKFLQKAGFHKHHGDQDQLDFHGRTRALAIATVRPHATVTHHLRQVASHHHHRRLIIDAALEIHRAPVHELNCALGLEICNSRVHILWNHIAAIHQVAPHLFFHDDRTSHTWSGFEDRHRDSCNGKLFVVTPLCGNHQYTTQEHEVDVVVWHELRLEYCDVDIKHPIEPQRCRQR